MKIFKLSSVALAAMLASTSSFAGGTAFSLNQSAKALGTSTTTTKSVGGKRLALHVLSVHSGFTERQLSAQGLSLGKLSKAAMLAKVTGTSLGTAAAQLDSGTSLGRLVVEHGNAAHAQIALTSAVRGMNVNGTAAESGLEDTDGDGLVNAIDDDVDGDGIENGVDDDIDGDGILNADDQDTDGDGIDNADDDDIDGDDVANDDDGDVDGDGDDNGIDLDDDGDGLSDDVDQDEDGDGTDNANDDDQDEDDATVADDGQ